jgi:hypothetical protein
VIAMIALAERRHREGVRVPLAGGLMLFVARHDCCRFPRDRFFIGTLAENLQQALLAFLSSSTDVPSGTIMPINLPT